MQKHLKYFTFLLKQLIFLLIVFTICRIIFLLFNLKYFNDSGTPEIFKAFLFGLRFDLSAILAFNVIFIFFQLLPFKFRKNNLFQKILKYLFIIVNSILILANCIDFVYFRFILKRTTFDIFNYMVLGSDFFILLPSYIKSFWYILLIWILLILFLNFIYNKILRFFLLKEEPVKFYYLFQSLIFILCFVLTSIGIRGGLQYKPITIIDAGKNISVQNIPLVLNTPFAIIQTWNKAEIKEIKYFDEQKLKSIYNPVHNYYDKNKPFRKLNVVIIVMESFSKEYTGLVNDKNFVSYTPFLDSLIKESLVFRNAFANGSNSISGIPAIVAGIPSLMNEPYITSVFAGNKIYGLAALLRKEGYATSFFHGGTNGTMGFEAFASVAGFEKYYGRKEYDNEKDYDGNWGIYDEEFFKFFAGKLNGMKQPFFSTFFSLSSHHPYSVPVKYKNRFNKGKLKIHESIGYADYSMKRFFDAASKSKWFDNTLFIITADHTGEAEHPAFSNVIGKHEIPLIFYMHNNPLKEINNEIAQQIDIMPSILDYLNYPAEFISFGVSLFDTTSNHFAVNYPNNNYQLLKDDYSIIFNGSKITEVYNLKTDSLLQNNLVNKISVSKNEDFLKAFIQSYNWRLIKNKLVP
ncbi:MAG: sulfatase-like hydrolase/transferase [Bacteroidales bacterium]|nr:sulfatase-like hydrolase/transferase [Bacteroidales bacterium]